MPQLLPGAVHMQQVPRAAAGRCISSHAMPWYPSPSSAPSPCPAAPASRAATRHAHLSAVVCHALTQHGDSPTASTSSDDTASAETQSNRPLGSRPKQFSPQAAQQQWRQQQPPKQQERRKQPGIPGAHRRQRALVALREQLASAQQVSAETPGSQPQAANLAAAAGDSTYELPTGLSVTWLGTSSGSPTPVRNVSCTVVRVPGALYLVDTGEGSVRQLAEAGVKLKDVDRICLTHLHGDHCFGIGSIIRRVSEARLEALGPDCPPIHVYGPPALAELIHASLFPSGAGGRLPVKVVVTGFVGSAERACPPKPMEPSGTLLYEAMAPSATPHVPALQDTSHLNEAARRMQGRLPRWPRDVSTNATPGQAWFIRCDNGVTIAAAQLQHRIPCWGYVFQEPPSDDIARQRKVVILGDTMDSSAMAPLAYGADLVSHEATFSEGMEEKARIAQHSTGWMAGLFAARVKARHLVLTHFSARYDKGRAPVASRSKGGKAAAGDGELSLEEELAAQSWAVQQLVAEARTTYGSGSISAAQDFLTIHIPKPQRPPFTNMLAVLQWVAAAEVARLALPHAVMLAALATST